MEDSGGRGKGVSGRRHGSRRGARPRGVLEALMEQQEGLGGENEMHKNFVLDTNVLLHDPRAIYRFADNTVIIPIYVIEEIDTFKKNMNELGRNAREAARQLDTLSEAGRLGDGVEMPGGGQLKVMVATKQREHKFLNAVKKDNLILACALEVQELEPEVPCILITKDTNLRVRADALGLSSENFEEREVVLAELYPGACQVYVSAEALDELHDEGRLEVSVATTPPQTTGGDEEEDDESGGGEAFDRYYTNEYVLLRSHQGKQTSLGRVEVPADAPGGQHAIIRPLSRTRENVWGVRPRNKEQAFALDALLDPEIGLVTLIGKAGTGKTLVALAAGLKQVTDDQTYHKMVVARPVVPMGRDLGYLPGTVEEKLGPWMRPIVDNVEYLMGITRADKRAGRGAEELMDMGIIEIEPLTYIRGRSLPNQFIIVDEAQNLTPHEVKTILTRVGEGTKIVLTGDPYQIDNPYVDSESNGLTYTANRFKGQAVSATVTLFKGERSELAELAANLL